MKETKLKPGEPIDFDAIKDGLASGIDGFIMVEGDVVYLPFIEVLDTGKGKCQAYLAQLEAQYKMVKVPNVLSSILVHILKKRGYKLTYEYSKEFKEAVDVWVFTK